MKIGERVAKVEVKIDSLCKLMTNHLTEHKNMKMRRIDWIIASTTAILLALRLFG